MQGKVSPVLLVIALVLVAGAIGITYKLIQNEGGGNGPDGFPAEEYLEAPKNFIGSKYTIVAQIKEQIDWLKGAGKMMEVAPINAPDVPLLVFIPDDADLHMHVGQRYRMEVVIDQMALIRVQELEKQ